MKSAGLTFWLKNYSFQHIQLVNLKTSIEMKKIRWGVLSTANIGLEKVIPAMQQGEYLGDDDIERF